MRVIPHDISDRVARTMQTAANNANPSADIWISRPNTALVSDAFLERQTIFDTPVTDASIAVCHPRFKADNTMIFIGYVSDGKARVISALTKSKMDEHTWLNHDFEEDADSVSIAFDGVMKMGVDDKIEFVTETSPWIFWTSEGVLYTQKLDSGNEPEVLAVANCTDVSAVCASDSAASSFNFGLIVFFVLAGTLYYRQLIDGVWMDGVPVSYAPTNIVEIAAFRTWDHRVGVQMKTEDGKIHEIYTQYMGIGKRSTEHIDISTVRATGRFVPVLYHDTVNEENISISEITAFGKSTWGLSSVPVKVENLDDGTGNYGFYVKIHLDHPVTNVDGTYTRFKMADSVGIKYICNDAYADDDGMSMVLQFMNFNLSEGNDLTVTYTAESPHILSPAANFNSFEYTFTPIGLKRPDIPVPEPVRGWVTATNGTGLAIEFTQDIVGPTVVDNEANFIVSFQTYDFVPGGSLITVTRAVTSIGIDGTDNRKLHLGFDSGITNSLQNCVGDITVAYTDGTIYGEGGPVADFEITFTPDDMEVKHNPNVETGHVEIGNVVAIGNLVEVTYHNTNNIENISISEISAVGKLTHINDL